MQRRYTRTGFSVGSSHHDHSVSCVFPVVFYCCVFSLLGFCCFWVVTFATSDGRTLVILVHRIEYQRPLRAQYVEPLSDLLFLEQVNDTFDSFLSEIDPPTSHSLVTSLLIFSDKEEVVVSVRWYIGHHCPWNSFLGVAPLPLLWHRRAGEQSRLSYQSVCRKVFDTRLRLYVNLTS